MLFRYKAVDDKGINKEGEIDASNRDLAISGLQHRGLVVIYLENVESSRSILGKDMFERVTMRDIVIFSRQISTLFEAQISALKAFTMLAANSENKLLGRKLSQVAQDLQGGMSISNAMAKHPDVFSDFYVNMVKAGEEVGNLDKTFSNLARYLDRQYTLTSKARNALIYPVLVIVTFFVVMTLMFVVVIPKLSAIIKDSAQEVPVFTKIIIGMSEFFVSYGFIIIIFLVLFGVWLWWLSSTEKGKDYIDKTRLNIPVIGNLYRKLFLSRISDNLDTMLTSGIPIVRSIDITAKVVGSRIYGGILKDAAENVKSGMVLSAAFEKYPDQMPNILIQMVKVGEETGSLGPILKTLGDFYKREVDDAVDTLVGLIEPIMIVMLGLGVGVLLVSVLMPIYNIASSVS
ncbi:MAG: type II secretion system F family protein [Candidatus Pacebacteria bacterium]|nr:type II secretion system F family protein [Candidatus Paceibacterota bacterium]MBP9839714.1 type II secretion system F family protein [Candidatus Paceibacterota bacterium]MDQ5922343.1 type pilus assembly protein PilC [Patescibacteria group bacterium]